MKRRIVFVTKDGTFLPMAIRCQEEGSDVRVYWNKKPKVENGVGLIDPCRSVSEMLRFKPDAVIFDSSGFGKEADGLRKLKLPVYGSSPNADILEFDRDGSLALIEDVGIAIPDSKVFTSFPEAQSFLKSVEKEGDGWVIKLDGEKYAGSSLTFVAGGPQEAREVMESYRGVVKTKVDITLQKKIDGIEISSEGFWNGYSWEESFWNHTFERKKFGNADLGPNIGCAGDVVFRSGKDRAIKESVALLEKAFKRFSFYGQVDTNTIVSYRDDKVYGLELTPRFGINASLTMHSMWETELSDWFCRVAKRQSAAVKYREAFGASVTISVPPFPATKTDGISAGVPVSISIPMPEGGKFLSDFNLLDVNLTGDHLVTAGKDGWVSSPCGQGGTMNEAVSEAYQRVYDTKVPNMFYRTDIGKNAEQSYDDLKYRKMLE